MFWGGKRKIESHIVEKYLKNLLNYRKDGIMATVDGVNRIYPRNKTILPENSNELCWWKFSESRVLTVKYDSIGLVIKLLEWKDILHRWNMNFSEKKKIFLLSTSYKNVKLNCRKKAELKNKGMLP